MLQKFCSPLKVLAWVFPQCRDVIHMEFSWAGFYPNRKVDENYRLSLISKNLSRKLCRNLVLYSSNIFLCIIQFMKRNIHVQLVGVIATEWHEVTTCSSQFVNHTQKISNQCTPNAHGTSIDINDKRHESNAHMAPHFDK